MTTASEWYDTAKATLDAIARYYPGAEVEVIDAYDGTPDLRWELALHTHRSEDFERTFQVWSDGTRCFIDLIVYFPKRHDCERTRVFERVLPDRRRALLGHDLSLAIIGQPGIPPVSRREVKAALTSAHRDAAAIFTIGMARMTPADRPAFEALEDDSEKWEVLSMVAASVKGEPFCYLPTWRSSCVPFHVFDIYDDALIEAAVEYMATVK